MKEKLESGQALIALLFFAIIATTYALGAVYLVATNSLEATNFSTAAGAYMVSESAAEEGILKLLRDPSYSGETFNFETGSATLDVSGDSIKTINVSARSGDFVRKLVITLNDSGSNLSIISWKEEF